MSSEAKEQERREAIAQLLAAKRDEEAARERRYAAEKRIIELFPSKDEGQQTTREGSFSVTVKHGVSRRLDAEKWKQIYPQIDPSIAAHLVTYKPSLSTKGFRWIQDNDPETFALVSTAVTTKPTKPSVSVRELDE